MASTLITQKLREVRKSKNRYIFILSFSILVIVVSFLVFLITSLIDVGLLLTIYFLVLIGYYIVFAAIKSKITYCMMQYNYLMMVADDQMPITINRKLFTKDWLANFPNNGYEIGFEDTEVVCYYKQVNQVDKIGRIGRTLVAIFVTKKDSFIFYSEKTDGIILQMLSKIKNSEKIQNQVVIQFRKYDQYDEATKEQINEIINFSANRQTVVQITAGYLYNDDQVQFLRPLKRYPNKIYYYACSLIRLYSGIKEVSVEQEK